MGVRRGLALLALVPALAVLPQPAAAAKKPRLKAFPACSTFVHYARRHALRELRTRGIPEAGPVFAPNVRGNPGAPQAEQGPTAAPTPVGGAEDDFSTTNVQEAGVDEPDAVKTDGRRIFVVANGMLHALDARSDPPKLLGSLELGGYGQELLLDGDRLLVMSGNPIYYAVDFVRPVPAPGVRAALAPGPQVQTSKLTLVDVSDPAAMRVLRTLSVDGGYLTARMTGRTARVVLSATPNVLPVLQTAAPEARRPTIARTTTPNWRPSYRVRRGTKGRVARRALVRCTSIQRSPVFSGLNSLTVLTINLAKGLDPVDADAVMTDGQTVYASQDSLYVATQRSIAEDPSAEQPPAIATQIHRFDISDPDETVYRGSGTVTGTLLNQYSMSEQDGLLRVASTDSPLWWSPGSNRESESFVTVLKPQAAGLTAIGRVGGLGRGERIYAVRFLGDVGYVVTFRQVDPLYTVGLSDPAHPKVLGSLDLLGYSAYLHPVGDGLLLGVGQSATEQGRTLGTQVSLFDVSDPAKPARLSNAVVAGGSSDVEFDPHAFLWWDPQKLAVIPVQVYDYDDQTGDADVFSGAIGFRATRADGVREAGRLAPPADAYGYAPPVMRTLVVGERLFAVSTAGVLAGELTSFADRGFTPFPEAQAQTGGGGGVAPSEPASPPSR